jgi:hypothetical protein
MQRGLIAAGLIGMMLLFALNIIPYLTQNSLSTYIRQDAVLGMAIQHDGLLYTLNFDQQKEVIDILNRALPVDKYRSEPSDRPLDFEKIVIYRFDGSQIDIKPLAWVRDNLVFSAPDWSIPPLKEVSKARLFEILQNSYDKQP